jgi:hypothetical protein
VDSSPLETDDGIETRASVSEKGWWLFTRAKNCFNILTLSNFFAVVD